MTSPRRRRLALLAAFTALTALAASPALAGEPARDAPSAQPPSPAFEALKGLAGEWIGTARMGSGTQSFPATATIKVVSGGSAVMLVTGPGTEHEMVTMFHRDDDALIATHYCAAMNQPRMRARPDASAKQVTFDFFDGTNLKAHPGRMQSLVMAMPDANRHVETWVSRDGAKEETMRFDLERVR